MRGKSKASPLVEPPPDITLEDWTTYKANLAVLNAFGRSGKDTRYSEVLKELDGMSMYNDICREPFLLRCRYCNKVCISIEEIQRKHFASDKGGIMTVCNPCGGYEHCPVCGVLWENLGTPGVLCLKCEGWSDEHKAGESK